MIPRTALGAVLAATLSTAALAQSLDAPAGIRAATAPGGLTGHAAPSPVERLGPRSDTPASVGERAAATGSVRGERVR